MPLEINKADNKKTPHLALCHESQGFSANNRPVSLLMKSGVEFTEEIKKALSALGYDINKAFYSQVQEQLRGQLQEMYGDDDQWLYIEDFDETQAIFCTEGCLYSVKYSNSDGVVTVDDTATPVTRMISYNPIEGKVELSEQAEDMIEDGTYKLVKKALENPESAERIGNIFKVTKKEGDENLPASAFAYTPDKESPSTWKLRIDDANHTRAAVAALGAGFRGNKVEIPSDDLAAVKRKVSSAYKKFFPDKKDDLPEILKSNVQEITLKEEIEKAVAAVETLLKAQIATQTEALEKASARIKELEQAAVIKARKEMLASVEADVTKLDALVKSLEALDDASFGVVASAMVEKAKAVEESDLFKQHSRHMTQDEPKEGSFDEMMKAKYGVK